MKKYKNELIVGVVSGFLSGLILFMGGIMREGMSDRIVAGVMLVLFLGVIFWIMRMKE